MTLASSTIGFKHTTIGGQQELVQSQLLPMNPKYLSAITADLSQEETTMFYAELERKNLEKINDGFKMRLRLNAEAEDRSIVRKIVRTESGTQTQELSKPMFIYERDEKTYADKEKLMWQPRIDLIEKAFATKNLFSISIVPSDPTIAQTWYDKKSVYKIDPNSIANEEAITALFGNLPITSEAPSIAKDWKMDDVTSFQKASGNVPATESGFFAPFSTFSSDLMTAQYDPAHLPNTVISAKVFSAQELDPALSYIQSSDLKKKIESIVESFKDDLQATGMGLVILEPPRTKVLYLTK